MPRHRNDGKHTHECPSCKSIWEHGNLCSLEFGGTDTPEGLKHFESAHTCPVCGMYEGDRVQGNHGTGVTPTVIHPVVCAIGNTPRDREGIMLSETLERLQAWVERKAQQENRISA